MKSFTISAPPGETPTLQGNTGKVTFTVTNTATRTVDGTVMAKPTAPAEESWFSFPEGATRTYQPGAVMSVATTVTVPPGTPTGTYTFRLDAKAEDNPDEDYTEGPSAQFIVPAAPKPVPWWKRYWWIAVIVAVVLIGGVVAALLLSGGDDGDVAVTTPTATPTPTPKPPIPQRNCAKVEGGSVSISARTRFNATSFAVNAPGVPLGFYSTAEDANRVAELARAFTLRCFIDASNPIEYWLEETGQPLPQGGDCFEYDPRRVEIEKTNSAFVVRDPKVDTPLGTVGNGQQADDLKAVASEFTRRCFIGRGGSIVEVEELPFPLGDRRTERTTTVMDYWEK
jgi:hypothetical protein